MTRYLLFAFILVCTAATLDAAETRGLRVVASYNWTVGE